MSRSRIGCWLASASCLLLFALRASADPWLAPGDAAIRSDIQLLADAGILRGPVTTWPISWPDVARDALAARNAGYDDATEAALLRVQRMARAASSSGFAGLGMRVSAAHEPVELRAFADTPREEGELALRASWLSDRFALNLQGVVVADADDGRRYRADGSYLGINIGNFMISAGLMERWWGPGWDGSLILSTNARPIPSVTIERNYTDPFRSKLLSWIGPWRASIAIGEAERSGVAVSEVRLLAARVNFRPRPWLELGLTRTAQWCGGDRPCGWQAFSDMLLGRDNREPGADPDDEPGNQLAGYDMRLRSPWRRVPIAFYTQWIGEDEAGYLPSKFMGLFGLEYWRHVERGALRLRAEYADTTCVFTREEPQFDCAYRNSIYPQGYTHRGRIIGHSLDNDTRMWSFGGLFTHRNGDVLSLDLRQVEVNRDGGGHSISASPVDLHNVELRYSRAFDLGKATIGVGYDDFGPAPGVESGARGFLIWQQGF